MINPNQTVANTLLFGNVHNNLGKIKTFITLLSDYGLVKRYLFIHAQINVFKLLHLVSRYLFLFANTAAKRLGNTEAKKWRLVHD